MQTEATGEAWLSPRPLPGVPFAADIRAPWGAPVPPAQHETPGSRGEQTPLPPRTFSDGQKGWWYPPVSVGKAVAGSGFKAACEPRARAAGSWGWGVGRGAGACRGQTFACTSQGPFCPSRRPPVSQAVSASKKKIKSEGKGKRKILSATSNIGKTNVCSS